MKFAEFKIKNFKGIENITFNLDKSPEANIYTLVRLNESGKTTILEAMNLFSPKDKGLSALNLPGSTISDYNSLIPISKRDNLVLAGFSQHAPHIAGDFSETPTLNTLRR